MKNADPSHLTPSLPYEHRQSHLLPIRGSNNLAPCDGMDFCYSPWQGSELKRGCAVF